MSPQDPQAGAVSRIAFCVTGESLSGPKDLVCIYKPCNVILWCQNSIYTHSRHHGWQKKKKNRTSELKEQIRTQLNNSTKLSINSVYETFVIHWTRCCVFNNMMQSSTVTPNKYTRYTYFIHVSVVMKGWNLHLVFWFGSLCILKKGESLL